jgi:hypothetical protein
MVFLCWSHNVLETKDDVLRSCFIDESGWFKVERKTTLSVRDMYVCIIDMHQTSKYILGLIRTASYIATGSVFRHLNNSCISLSCSLRLY